MKAFADKRQGQDGKLVAVVGSDEAFLEQTKPRALQLCEMVCLAKTTRLRNPTKRSWNEPSSRPEKLWDMHFWWW